MAAVLEAPNPPRLWLSFQHVSLSERNHSAANAAAGTAGFKSSIASTLLEESLRPINTISANPKAASLWI